MDQSLVPNFTTLFGGILGAAIAAAFPYFAQKNKSEIDETANVMGAWKELMAAHKAQMEGVLLELSDVRTRLATAEKEIVQLRKENAEDRDLYSANIRERDDTIAGLHRQIAQNSSSSAQMLEPQQARDRAPTASQRFAADRRKGKGE